MPRFEILEHTADIGVRAFGGTLAKLFENAALGLQSIALDPDQVRPVTSYPIAAAGEDREALLVNWLNEIVYYLDGKRVAISRIAVQELTECSIAGEAWGETRETERHPPRLVIKAATYHQLRIEQDAEGWTADVYLDV